MSSAVPRDRKKCDTKLSSTIGKYVAWDTMLGEDV